MKKFFVILLALSLILVVAVGGGAYYLSANMDKMIKNQAEEHIPHLTKTSFSLGEVETELMEGKLALHDLNLGNPEGFPDSHSLKFDSVFVQVDVDSLQGDKIGIKSFILNGLDVYLVKREGQKSNLEVILDNVKEFLKQHQGEINGETIEETLSKAKKTASDLKFQVDLLEINKGRLLVHANEGVSVNAEAEIPLAKLEGVGAEGNGVSFDVLVEKVIQEVIKEVEIAVNIGNPAREEIERDTTSN